jgi:hypothetical protein
MTSDRLVWALEVLGLTPGDSAEVVRTRYRELLRTTHPDVSSAGTSEATDATVQLTEAHRIVLSAIDEHGQGSVPRTPAPSTAAEHQDLCHHPRTTSAPDIIEIRSDGDTISMTVPPAEAFAILLDAGARIGGIGYVDRALGLLEVIVRFEGGPSCSVLITLQGRAFGTDAFITMESIEAAPTPPFGPVIEALLEQIEALHLT